MIVNTVKGGSGTNTKDATIEAKEIMLGEIGYGASGKVIGTAPLSFVETNTEGIDTYKLENTAVGMNITAEGCEARHLVVENSKVQFEDELSSKLCDVMHEADISISANVVCYGNGRFVAVGDGNQAAYSEDGVTWTQTTMPSSQIWTDVVYGNDKFVALGRVIENMITQSCVIASSTDGITWTEVNAPNLSCHSICYGDGKFVTITPSSIAYSVDGINWSEFVNISTSTDYLDITYGNNMFVVIGNGSVAYSTDAVIWATSDDINDFCSHLCYGNGKFIAVGYDGTAAYSTDGINWVETIMPSSTEWISVCYGGDKFVAVGLDNNIVYSIDGISWYKFFNSIDNNTIKWMSVCYGGDKFVAVADGIVAYSAIKDVYQLGSIDTNIYITAENGDYKCMTIGESEILFKNELPVEGVVF